VEVEVVMVVEVEGEEGAVVEVEEEVEEVEEEVEATAAAPEEAKTGIDLLFLSSRQSPNRIKANLLPSPRTHQSPRRASSRWSLPTPCSSSPAAGSTSGTRPARSSSTALPASPRRRGSAS